MEIFLDYGLFVAKLVTVLILVLFFFAVIASRTHRQDSPVRVKIRNLNRHMKGIENQLQSQILPEKQWKKLVKQDKKEEKQHKKQGDRPVAYVMNFVGDMQASNIKHLSDTVSAVISVAKPNQEVILKLESSGGYVHSYGLAAAQLLRLREHKLKLTICVDKVAASGGYLMAAMGNKICAAPFAILGSIGVVGMVPNISKLLNKSNIDVEYHTSGEYKRTLTVVGKNDAKGRKKFKQDLQQTHKLFKDIVKQHRPSLSLPQVATGEVWYGLDAKKKKLIDDIITSDEYLLNLAKKSDLYEISVRPKRKLAERVSKAGEEATSSILDRLVSRILESRLFNL